MKRALLANNSNAILHCNEHRNTMTEKVKKLLANCSWPEMHVAVSSSQAEQAMSELESVQFIRSFWWGQTHILQSVK